MKPESINPDGSVDFDKIEHLIEAGLLKIVDGRAVITDKGREELANATYQRPLYFWCEK